MTDEILITRFLNKGYSVTVSSGLFWVKDNNLDCTWAVDQFKTVLSQIFGEVNNINIIYRNWFDKMRNILIKRLTDFFITLDLKEKSELLVKKCHVYFLLDKEFDIEFITKMFEDYYMRYAIAPIIESFVVDKTKIMTSSDMLLLLEPRLDGETFRIKESIANDLNIWYYDNVFALKISEFINRLKIELGITNWVVRHDLYGEINPNKLNQYCLNETKYQQTLFRKYFDQWFEERVMYMSEKMMTGF